MAMRLTISDEMIETLKSHVSFGTRADLQDFVADAMNTYIQLGALPEMDTVAMEVFISHPLE